MNIEKHVGKLPEPVRQSLEQFRGLSEQEAQIERLYEPHSITYLATDGGILGTIRLIMKRTPFEKLPCEFAHIVEMLNDAAPIIPLPDGTIEIPVTPDLIPVAEVGGLMLDRALPLTLYGAILKTLMLETYAECFALQCKVGYISCEINPQLERLYVRNFHFEPAAVISYTMRTNYKLFFLWNTTIIPESHQVKQRNLCYE